MCRDCYSKAWRDAHPGYYTSRNANYHAANRARRKAYKAAWYAANRDARMDYSATYRETHPEVVKAYTAAYRVANAEKIKVAAKAWQAANPVKVRAISSRRRATKKGANPDLTAAEWLAILVEHDYCCAYCGRSDLPMQVEHMTPLSRGGGHTASNVVPACAPCNYSKHTKTALEFAGWSIPPRRVSGTSG